MSAKFDTIASPPLPTSQELSRQVERILTSSSFRGSEVLRNLLSFLTACALESRPEPVKVKEIATAVFGRSAADFDSQSDSVVRVHTGRLRSKLAEYYMGDGVEDEVIVSIPKGSYALECHFRHLALHAPASLPEPALEELITAPSAPGRHRASVPLAAAIALILLAIASTWGGMSLLNRQKLPDFRSSGLHTIWNGFLGPDDTPLIVFSNLRLADPFDPGRAFTDSYTTVGEVMGVFNVSRTLSIFGKTARAKRAQLLTWDDAKDSNLIFIGGPLAETPLREVSLFTDFQFKPSVTGDHRTPGAILNVHPRPGEPTLYAGPGGRPFTFDYALVALRPAFSPHHWILAIAGITEFGTWGASEFMTREEPVRDLLAKLNVKEGAPVPWFEALLRVRVEGGVPVQTGILLVHKIG